MSEIRLLKTKIVKKGESLTVEYSRQEKDGSTTIISEEHKAPVHQDLKNAFFGLHVHFAILSDYLTVKVIKDIRNYDSDLIEPFTVSGVHRGGAEDEEYIILTGHKLTASGKAVIINTPMLKLNDEEGNGYKHLDHLIERVEFCEKEVKAYLAGKHAPEPQTSLDFPDDEPVTIAQIAPHVDLDSSMNSPEAIAAAIVAEANGKGGKPKRTKVPQSSKHKDGQA